MGFWLLYRRVDLFGNLLGEGLLAKAKLIFFSKILFCWDNDIWDISFVESARDMYLEDNFALFSYFLELISLPVRTPIYIPNH